MDLSEQAAGIGALADASRRALYQYVVAQPDAVGREQAAAALGMATSTAGFHLDKLVAEGLLDTERRRLTGRTGPGAGRPSKLYRRSEREFAVTLPERRYRLVGEILAAAYDRAAGGEPLEQALAACAREEGLAAGGRHERGSDDPAPPDLAVVAGALSAEGYDARLVDAAAEPSVALTNCPFHALAQRHTELVCGLNVHFVQGVADGVGCAGARAALEPDPERCCVTVRRES